MLFTKPTMVDPRVALKGRDVAVLNQPFFHRVFGHRIDRVPEYTLRMCRLDVPAPLTPEQMTMPKN